MPKRLCWLPPRYAVQLEIGKNPILQLNRPATEEEFEVVPYQRDNAHGERLTNERNTILILPRTAKDIRFASEPTVITKDGKAPSAPGNAFAQWLPDMSTPREVEVGRLGEICDVARQSWFGQFNFKEEEQLPNGELGKGLRPPQVGGLHAAIAHWKMSEEPATIVMPTGTGKTETMLALMLHERPHRLLVVVPSDVLRSQISRKFIDMGLLRTLGICGPSAKYPVVGVLKHGISDAAALRTFLESCNVVVTTMSLVARF